jgi:glycosyltransferase involved in cell wall biosynthesis
MIQALTFLWILSLLILLGYHLIVFRSRDQKSSSKNLADFPGVSIVIAVKNGSEHLIKNINAFLSQDYPLFEIIIVNDHSNVEEQKKLEDIVNRFPQVLLLHLSNQPGKKQALTLGIQHAKHEHILCTDADCFPTGDDWIKSMIEHSTDDAMVLGYSPYYRVSGLLNLFIRFETVMTGIQYLSWAMAGKAYMGVGRNILYSKKLFLRADPYKDHQDIPYGDDDLWVQQAASLTKVNVNLDATSFVYSDPPHAWRSWFKQKHRHLSAGHYYKNNIWWQPGLFGLALIVHWILLPILVYGSWMNWIGLLFFAGLLIRWMVYAKWTSQLGEKDTVKWYPLLETGYALYLAGTGAYTLVTKKKTWN